MRAFYVVLVVFLATCFFFLYQSFVSESFNEKSSSLLCEFEQGKCKYEHQLGPFFLSADPKKIRTESEINFQLSHQNIGSFVIESAYLEGRDMYMGKIPLFFEEKEGKLSATTMLGACMEDKMVWTMLINVKHQQTPVFITFDFYSYR